MRLIRVGSILGALALLSVAVAPAALAAPLNRPHRGWDGAGFRGVRHAHHPIVVPAPVPLLPVPSAPVQAVPVPVPVPVPVAQSVLPALQQVLPGAGFMQNPPQFIPLQNNSYALSSPLLFCGTDGAGTCEQLAQQLAQVTPGWGTALMNGPQGYGVYLTYQPL